MLAVGTHCCRRAPGREIVQYDFSDCSLDSGRRELRRGADLITVEPQVLDLLLYLICNRARVVSKDDLIATVWKGRIVSDSTLTSRISAARKAIGDSGGSQRLIRTLARKGIRFVGEVRESHDEVAHWAGYPTDFDSTPGLLPGTAPLHVPDKPSIAVLPFMNMSGDPEKEYFSDGITEDITTALSRLRWFFVIARNSTFAYKGAAADVRVVGRELGVRYILEGSVRGSAQRVRVTAQLIDATSGNHMWAERYDRHLTDIFALQDAITDGVVTTIEPKVLAAEGMRAEARSVESLDAWGLVARAVTQFWKLSANGSETAIDLLEQAVKSHPNYAPSHSLLAFALLVAAHMGWRRFVDTALVERLALRAVELDDSDPWAYMALGYLAFSARRTDEAVAHFFDATSLNPNFAAAYGYAGWVQAHDGRSEEAIKNLQTAIRLSPRDPFNVFYLAGFAAAHYLAGRYTEAAEYARQALRLRPSHLGARRKLCASLAQAGLIADARREMARLRELQPDISVGWIERAVPYTCEPMVHFLEGMRKAGLPE
jgi:TolB-like protein/Tfp pilus assembly protein PilF